MNIFFDSLLRCLEKGGLVCLLMQESVTHEFSFQDDVDKI